MIRTNRDALPPRARGGSRLHILAGAGLGALLLVGCTVGQDYARPSLDVPSSFREAGEGHSLHPGDQLDRGTWWAIYKDPVLDSLEKQIDISSQTIKAAEASYRAAQAVRAQTQSGLYPTLSVSGAATKTAGTSVQTPGTTYATTADVTWAPDVWGKIRRSIESDTANVEASAADLASARLAAQAALATTYFDLRAQDELIRNFQSSSLANQKIFNLVSDQYKAGQAAQTDVFLAKTQYESVRAQAINATLKRSQLEHALAILIGKTPSSFTLQQAPFLQTVPVIPPEVPSALLERRPDIASAERAVMAANARIGVAESAWFPDVTLTASSGFTGSVLGSLLQASNGWWGIGSAVVEKILDAGAREANIDRAKSDYDKASALYRQAVLTAFREVEDQLAAQRILTDLEESQSAATQAARQAEKLAKDQYAQGFAPYDSLLNAQIFALNNAQNAIMLRASRLDASVALVAALGGGWQGISSQQQNDLKR